MNKKIDDAIKKITIEMMENENNSAIRIIEEHLTSICTTEEVADKILNPEKTLKGALKEIRKEAQKSQVNGCGFVDDKTGFKITEQYFEISLEENNENGEVIDIRDLI